MKQRRLIYKISRDSREIGHSKHRVIDAHAVPRHLSVTRRSAPESYCGQRGTSVAFHKNRRIERKYISHRKGYILLQHGGIERGLLNTDLLHGPTCRHCDLPQTDIPISLRICTTSHRRQYYKIQQTFHFQQNAPGVIPT